MPFQDNSTVKLYKITEKFKPVTLTRYHELDLSIGDNATPVV